MQTPKTVDEFVEEEKRARLEPFSQLWNPPDSEAFGRLIRRAVKFGRTLGLQEALGAGPKERSFFGEESEFCHEHSEKDCEFCQGQNVMLSAKNSAITALIEKGEQGKV